MPDNSFFGDEKIIILFSENHVLVPPPNFLSDVNKTYIDIGNGWKFELKLSLQIPIIYNPIFRQIAMDGSITGGLNLDCLDFQFRC